MSRLHYCKNGVPVTNQVLAYQSTRDPDDYLPIQEYYNDYKDHWFGQVDDYIDRTTFESDFDYKLCRAVDSFKIETADDISAKKGYTKRADTRVGAFNGWFYKILANWKSNIKTSSFRLKKRPPTQCPICGRFVGRIDVEHLQHYRGISDLPKYFTYKGEIYETSAVPRVNAITWGSRTLTKWRALQKADFKPFASEKKRVEWLWRTLDGKKGVMCPFTKKVIPQITVEYIRTLDDRYSRYAEPFSWEDFAERYPSSLIQMEIGSLEHTVFETGEDGESLKNHVSTDHRVKNRSSGFDYDQMCRGVIPPEFEHAFDAINKTVSNESDRQILKLIAVGYSVDDVAETLEMDKKEVRKRIRNVRDNASDMKKMLVG